MINNDDIKIIKEAITKRQELLTTCAVLQDELRKEIAAAKKMLEQKKLNNSIKVRLHGVYQFNNGKIGYCYEVNKDTAVLFVGSPYNDIIVCLDGNHFGYRTRDGKNLVGYTKAENWSIRRTYKKKYDKEKENGHE